MARRISPFLMGICLCVATTAGVVHADDTAKPGSTSGGGNEARLVSSTCAELLRLDEAAVQQEIAEMRAAIAESYVSWREEQPACWENYRANQEMWKEMQAAIKRGDRIGVGVSGRGLGFGYGIGGAGVGHGLLGGSHRAGSPSVRMSSATNVQVQGVDEADITKHDDRFVYFALNGALRIASIEPPRLVSVTPLPGRALELYIVGDRAVVYLSNGGGAGPRCTYAYDCQFAGDGSTTHITVLELGDRTKPRVRRNLALSGSLVASRRIQNTVHTVVVDGDRPAPTYPTWPTNLPRCGVYESAVKARLARLAADNERAIRAAHRSVLPTLSDGGETRTLCQNVARSPLRDGRSFTTLLSFDLFDDRAAPTSVTLQSRPGAVYASSDSLYLAVAHQRQRNRPWYQSYRRLPELTDVHRFRIGARPELTRYVGTGVVPGHVLNQFAMDEWQGHLRIATTQGRVPDPNVHSQVTILGPGKNQLTQLGALTHLAPGEDIRSVRFDQDRGYVVTFKKTDPLFVLDLSQAKAPRILAELKIPGFSTYLHRMDPAHLLSIGFDAEERGDFAYFDGILLQLFDVSQPNQPSLLFREKIGTRGSSSEAATNHLAFNYLPEAGLLAVPVTLCEGGGAGRAGDRLSFSGLLVYGVSINEGFRRMGGVDHGQPGASCHAWWSNASSVVKRSLFLDDRVWSVATDRAKVQRLQALGTDLADIQLGWAKKGLASGSR